MRPRFKCKRLLYLKKRQATENRRWPNFVFKRSATPSKEDTMSRSTAKIAAFVAAIAIVVAIRTRLGSGVESKPTHSVGIDTSETMGAKIKRAMSAGPPEIARSAKIIEKDAQGHTIVLREGSPRASLACPAIRRSSASLRCALTDHRCSGPLILRLINPGQPTPFQGSHTCSRVLLSAAIPIHMTKPA